MTLKERLSIVPHKDYIFTSLLAFKHILHNFEIYPRKSLDTKILGAVDPDIKIQI